MKAKAKIENNILLPAENGDFIGHKDAVKMLHDSYQSGMMHHAWLISGQKGIGKATLAYRFARFLLSNEKNPDLSVSLNNPTFNRIRNNSHSDLLVLETGFNIKTGKPAKEILVDDARKIGKFLRLTSSETAYRIIIIDSIDEMNNNAANSILKLLEEPPKNAIFLLVSHCPGRILPTIKSRCRQLKLRPLAFNEAMEVVNLVTPEVGGDEILPLIEIANGSPGAALNIYNEGGLELYEKVLGVFETLPKLDNLKLYELSDLAAKAGSNKNWELILLFISHLLAEFVLLDISQSGGQVINSRKSSIKQKLLVENTLQNIVQMQIGMENLVAGVNGLHLDKKLAIINLFRRFRN